MLIDKRKNLFKFLKENKSNFLIYFLFFIISALFSFAYFKEFSYSNLSSTGDYVFLVNAKELLKNGLFVYGSIFNNGYVLYAPNLLSLYVPVFFFFYILSFFHATGTISLVILISLVQFISAFSMYRYLIYLFGKFNIYKNFQLISSIFAILYSFSPYYYTLFKPGHFLFLILFASLPSLLKYFDLFIYSLNLKYLIFIFFIFFINAISFGNLGMVLVLFATLFLYSFIIYFFKKIKIKNFIFSIVLIPIIFLLSSLWWFLPTIISFSNFSELNQQSKETLGQGIFYATRDSYILNAFAGKPQNFLDINEKFNFSFDPYITAIYIFIFIVILFSYIKFKYKYNKIYFTIFTIFILISIYFTKGPNEPFSNIFLYLYNNVFGFQIFRRPDSKIFWLYLFSFSSLGAISFYYILNFIKNRYIKIIIYLFLAFSCLFFVFIFNFSKELEPFNIPNEYYIANNYFKQDDVTGLLLLPDLGGLFPKYNYSVNNLSGIDFINQVWQYRKYIPSGTEWTLDTGEKFVVNKLADEIYSNENFCQESKNLNLSHIIIRKDLVVDIETDKILKNIENNLSKSAYIKDKKNFGNSFIVFSLKDECRSSKILIDKGYAKFYENSPVKYTIHINVNKKTNLQFLEAFHKDWNLYLNNNNSNTPDIVYLYKKSIFKDSQTIVYDYANQWTIDREYIKQNFSKNYYKENPDGSIDIDLTLYFKPQSYFYLGLIVSGTTLFGCITYLVIDKVKNRKKKFKNKENK